MKLESTLAFVALIIACGPPGLPSGSDTSTDTTGSTETSTSTLTSASTSDPSTTSTTDTDSGDTDSSDSDHGFVPGLDLPVPPSCTLFAQDCGEGEKCVPYSSMGETWDAVKCVPVLGDQTTGEPCTYTGILESTDDCEAGNFCWNMVEVDGELVGTCHAFCTGSLDTPHCPEESFCAIYGADLIISLCIPKCDPLAQNCNEGNACYFSSLSGLFECVPTTMDLPTGAACWLDDDCVGGHYCLPAEWLPSCDGAACCAPYCHLELGDAPCAEALPGTTCEPFFEQGTAPPGLDHVGVCASPP